MSSLANQLKRIGTADANKGSEKAAKHRASFLFDSKQAADYDIDTIYSIGVNGCAELRLLDDNFAPFEKTLFSESMKNVDRALQSKEDNAKLDESITQFLRLLSPYFLLKPSGKALEWLIRRFRIHEFNIDAILHCILPYHESSLFVTMAAILRVDEASRWNFLLPIRKNKQPLDRTVLIQAMLKDRSLVEFVCEIPLWANGRRAFKTATSFYAAVILQYLATVPVITDDVLTVVLPHVITGLKARQSFELQIATYMILAQISERATLTVETLNGITSELVVSSTNAYQMLLCLVHLYQTQENYNVVADRTFQHIIMMQNIETHILSILEKYSAQRFMFPFLTTLAKRADLHPNNSRILSTILREARLPSPMVHGVCSALLDRYLALVKEDEKVEIDEQTLSILHVLHATYSKDLDSSLEIKLEETKGQADGKVYDQLYAFISKVFHGTRHQPLKESNTTLFLSVNHPEASIRLLAVKKLETILKEKKSELSKVDNTDTFVKDTLLARLQDDDERVTEQVLSMDALTKFVGPQDLLQGLVSVITAPMSSRGTRGRCLIYMLTVFLSNNKSLKDQVLSVVLGHLLLIKDYHKSAIALLSTISTSELKNEKLLKNVSSIVRDLNKDDASSNKTELLLAADQALIKTLAANLAAHPNTTEALSVYLEGLRSGSAPFRLLSIFVITKTIHQLDAPQQSKVVSQYLPVLLHALRAHSPKVKAIKAVAKDGQPNQELLTQILTKTWTPSTEVSAIHFSLLSVVSDLKKPAKQTVTWLSSEDLSEYATAVLSLYKTFVGTVDMSPYEEMIEKLFELHLTSDSIEFLCNLWTDSTSSSLIQVRSIQIASANLQAFASQTKVDAIDFQVVAPTLLIALGSPIKAMRETAVSCIQTIASIYPRIKTTGKKGKSVAAEIFKFDSFYGKTSDQLEFLLPEQISNFLNDLIKSREEFITDASYLSKHLGETLSRVASDSKAVTSNKDAVISFLLSHVLGISRVSSRVTLLQLLDGVTTPTKLKMLLPLIDNLVQTSFVGQSSEESTELARGLVRCFSPETSSLLESKSGKYKNAFLQLLKIDSSAATNTDREESSSSYRRLALGQVNSEFFGGLSVALQRDIFVVLIDLATNAPQDTVRVVKQVLRDIPVSGDLVIYELATIQSNLMAESMVEEGANTKRQRKITTEDTSAPSATAEALFRLVSVLELLEYKSIEESHKLVTPLFEMLSTIMNSDLESTPVSIEYVNQLMLSSLTNFVRDAQTGSGSSKIDESMLRVDLVVNCIRVTSNPQTHNQALLLMAAIAASYPEKVLHNIMPVFTFMGANVLRQDDNYSFHVIQQTLEKIIPPLVLAHRRQSDESKSLVFQVRPIIKVFVDALFHIPKHRRLRLFSILISTLGEDDFLYAVISLVIEKLTERATKGHQTEADSLNDFALALSNQFSAVVQMKSLIALMDVIHDLPNEKAAEGDVDMDEHLFDLSAHNNKQIRQFKLSVLTFATNVLTSKPFLSKIVTQTSTESSAEAILERHYLQMAERLLSLVGYFSGFVNTLGARKEQSAVVVKFWRGIVKITYDVLDKVHILLSMPSFVKIMVALFEHKDITIRRKAMGLFNQKIANVPGNASAVPAVHENMVVAVIDDLIKVVQADQVEGASMEEVAINKQTALMCISTIVRQFGASHPTEIVKAVPVIIGSSGLMHPNEQVKASCLVCLTFMCQELGVRAVPFLPKFMPVVLSILNGTLSSTNQAAAAAAQDDTKKSTRYNNSVLLQLAVVSHLETLVKVLPQFVSPYVTKVLAGTLHPVLAGYEGSDASKLQILEKNKVLLTEMASNIQPRILLPPMLGYYETAVKDGKDSLLALFDLVSQAVTAMPRDVIAVHYKQIFKFFLGAFDYRRVYGHEDARVATVAVVEDAIIRAFMQLVMKLNETLFKPLFLKSLDWSTTELQVAKASSQDMQDRLIFFYKLIDSLLDHLKSIVAPYYGYVVDNVIEVLTGYAMKSKASSSYEDEDNTDTVVKRREMDELWPWMISSLQKCFLHDNDGLWNADRFEKLLHPLVNQLLVTSPSESATTAGSEWKSYETRVKSFLVPCLGQLAVTLSNDALWKPLNYHVMLKTREQDKRVRLSALLVLQEFYKRLGEEFLILLPETIPFLAELMEDDDHEVEALTQQVIADIEVYLGGSLQKYFH
ncbi:HEAT repeat-containing protein 1 [Gryganskiella cystojenkinii]|nr:HEAT repeat-containing protein 1 [Gryganskiella cystojenkinii]